MELVYLWVEEYKNIKKQGFNFSPRFECKFYDKYHDDGTLKNDCELIIKPHTHISIFPKNINITAIVGENGSGKSSILEQLKQAPKKDEISNNKYFHINYENGKKQFYYYGNTTLNCIEYNLTRQKLPTQSVYILNQRELYDTLNFQYLNGKFMDESIFKDLKYKYTYSDSNIFIPKYINSYRKNYQILKKLDSFYNFDTLRLKLELTNSVITYTPEEEFITSFLNIQNQENIKTLDDLIQNQDDDIIKKALNLIRNKYPLKTQETLRKKENYVYIDIPIFNENQDKFNDDIAIFYVLQKIFHKDEKIEKNFIPIFNLELIHSKLHTTYNSMSSGEKNFVRLIIENVSHYENGHLSNKDNYVYLYDEVETSFHPELQKRVVKECIKIFKHFKRNINLVFATHSSFILSDIPKENVIFLENGEQKYPFKESEQTFGANIHTLLSHGFFMKDGLMGEFAKEKINEVINYLNDKESEITDNETAQKYINLIGEPIIKRQLQRILDSKRLTKVDKIDVIEKQIKILQEELKKVQK